MFGRRVEPRVDRRVACLAVGVVIATFVPLLALTSAPEPPLARTDVQAAFDFVRLLARGEQRDFLIESTFTRRRASGPSLDATQTEMQWGHVHVVAGGDSAEIDLPAKTYVCAAIDTKRSCLSQPPVSSPSVARVMATAIGSGTYDIVRAAGETIAGERAACFHVTLRRGARVVARLGEQTLVCLASDGLVLRTRVRSALGVDEQLATRVQRRVDEATVQALLAGFEAAPEPVHQ